MRRFLLLKFELSIQWEYELSHRTAICITIFNSIRNMSYQNYRKQPKQRYEKLLKIKNYENTSLISALDRSLSHPLFQKYSHLPFSCPKTSLIFSPTSICKSKFVRWFIFSIIESANSRYSIVINDISSTIAKKTNVILIFHSTSLE